MKKIPTVFLRDPATNFRTLTREVHPACQWVLDGEGITTRKFDGTCVMLDEDGRWWARREVKAGKQPPANFVALETDPATGKTVGWEPVEQSAFAKWHDDALIATTGLNAGTYELCGPKINGNPEGFDKHFLISHGGFTFLIPPERTYDALRTWLLNNKYEGIVYHHPDGRMAKIKRKDFSK
jgi:Family of unknown function (DUF5565)